MSSLSAMTGDSANHSGMTPYIFLPNPASHTQPQPLHNAASSHTAPHVSNPSVSDEDPSLVRFRFPLSSTTLDEIERDVIRVLPPPQSPGPAHSTRPTLRDTASSPSPPLLPTASSPALGVASTHNNLHAAAMSGADVVGDVSADSGGAAHSSPMDAVRRAASVALALSRLEDQGQGGGGGGGVDPGRQRWAPWELERQMQDSVRRCVSTFHFRQEMF